MDCEDPLSILHMPNVMQLELPKVVHVDALEKISRGNPGAVATVL
jgi:hypothetical protein